MIFKPLNDELKEYALKKFPEEMCGIVVDFKFIPCTNMSPDPENHFEISESQISEYFRAGKIQGIVHSHKIGRMDNTSCPSKQDMIGQISSNVPWGIVDTDGTNAANPYWWGDFLFDEALVGKKFKSGVNDCYSLCRKYYFQKKGILLPEYPRDDFWWSEGENLYVDNFRKAGFKTISKEELRDGDAMLGKIRSDTINHAGIIIDNDEEGRGLILHHLPNRLSRKEPASGWVNKGEICVRYVGVA